MTPPWARRPLIALDSFKDHLPAIAACEALAAAWASYFPASKPIICPLSDGGDGLVQVVTYHAERSLQPFQRDSDEVIRVQRYGKTLAVVESSPFLRQDRSLPFLQRSSANVGRILDGLRRAGHAIALGLGGSLTGEFGIGAFDILGGRAFNEAGSVLPAQVHAWDQVVRIEPAASTGEVTLWADVTSPAANMVDFLAQKGATDTDRRTAEAVIAAIDKISPHVLSIPGAGAGGALAVGLALAGWQITAEAGLEAMIRAMIPEWQEWMAEASVVVSGAGKLDSTSTQGKVEWQVASMARAAAKPMVILPGIWDRVHQPEGAVIAQVGQRFSWLNALREVERQMALKR